ncbi:hypothetical protein VZ94_08155 [Methylocucumis oryzae]|uniref:TonB-dependent receptor plug domain-containing protein n=2 Tax=Methylocucumis oryzae TaxID=1632867 RepID=A0A0F3IJS4_9GAMM|nr:hypothetical protein VZ94_08155 [Methylocucumis oryzae]
MLSLVVYLPASSRAALSELDPVTILAEPIPSASLNASTTHQNQFSEQRLIERGMTTYSDLNRQIANFHFIDAGVGSYTQGFSLRGLTNTDIFSDPAVVIYIDDVPYSNAGTVMGNWLNAETVTVYRGPEPGRLGKNAYAGAIVINSKQPSNTLRTALSYETGTYAQQKVTTTLSGALVNDQVYASVSGEYQARDAFLYNSYLNTTPDEQEHVTGQAMLKWLPNSAFDIRLIVTQQDFDYGATRWVNLASPDFFTVTSNVDEQLEQQADSQALRIAYTGDDYQWLSVSSRRYWSMNPNVEDFDLTPEPLLREQTLSEQAYSQEWRLQPKAFNSTWDWQIGLFYSHIEKQGVVNSWFYDIFVQKCVKTTQHKSIFGLRASRLSRFPAHQTLFSVTHRLY